MDIDLNKLKFVSREDEWFVNGTEAVCTCQYGDPSFESVVEDNVGIFQGYTNESYPGHIGKLPRADEEGCSFDEFDIYLNEELVNYITYNELIAKLIKLERAEKINKIENEN